MTGEGKVDFSDELVSLDARIQELEEQQAQLEAEQQGLHQELEQLYSELMAEFDRRWPPLKTLDE